MVLLGVLGVMALAILVRLVICSILLRHRWIRGLGSVFRNTGSIRLLTMVMTAGTDRIWKVVVTRRLVLMLIPVSN